jgi:glycosyltransferase involved in cell wall biosynthesis
VRILFLSNEFPVPHDHGKAIFNLRMCQLLAKRHDVRVVAPVAWTDHVRSAPPPSGLCCPTDYPTYYFPPRVMRAERGVFMWWSLRRHLGQLARTWRPDVVVSYWTHPDGEVAQRLAQLTGAPFVQIVGGSDVLLGRSDARRWKRVLDVLNGADAVITIGGQLAKEVVRLGIPAHKVTSIYRPVDATRFSPGCQSTARRALGLNTEAPLALWVGRMEPVKGLDTLVTAAAMLRSQVPELQVHLVGDGSDRTRLETLVKDRGLTGVVRFAGAASHEALADWYRSADVTALPSLSEGVPNVLLESIACGVPFVASAVGSVGDIADPSIDRLVPAGNAEALASALGDVLGHRHRPRVTRTVPATPEQSLRQLEAVFERASRAFGRPVAVAS